MLQHIVVEGPLNVTAYYHSGGFIECYSMIVVEGHQMLQHIIVEGPLKML